MTIKYTSFNTDLSEIRLVKIEPGGLGDEVHCSLFVVSLDNKLEYEALSYIWGDPSVKVDITVDGVLHPVTKNLKFALCRLRSPSQPRIIWVDALCINQYDVREKNTQVPLMGRIYVEASDVIACLGGSSPEINYFAEWAEVYYSKRPKYFWPLWAKKKALSWLTPAGHVRDHILNIQFGKGEAEFWKHAYFKRMWTVQEVSLAKSPPLFLVGDKSFRLTNWSDILHLLYKNSGQSLSRAIKYQYCSPELIKEFGESLSELSETVLPAAGVSGGVYLLNKDILATLPHALFATVHRQCSDPRDRIFALYSMLPKIQAAYPSNYEKPPEQVLLDTINYLVDHFPNFISILCIWPLRLSRLDGIDYPSWLPDLTGRLPVGSSEASVFMYCIDNAKAHCSVKNNVLSFDGWSLGKCKAVMHFDDEATKNLEIITKLMDGTIGPTAESQYWNIRPLEKVDLPKRLAYACHYHDFVEPHVFPNEVYDGIRDICKEGTLDRVKWEQLRYIFRVTREKAARLAGKVLFVTDSGLFGICSGRLQDDDFLVYSPSLIRPMVLRSREGYRDGDSEQCAKLVDFVFVDGIVADSENDEIMKWIQEQDLEHVRIG